MVEECKVAGWPTAATIVARPNVMPAKAAIRHHNLFPFLCFASTGRSISLVLELNDTLLGAIVGFHLIHACHFRRSFLRRNRGWRGGVSL